MLLRGFGAAQLVTQSLGPTAATQELQRRVLAAGITTEQGARDWLTQQTGIPWAGLDDQTAQAYLAVLNANAAAAAAASSPSVAPPPPAPSGPSLTMIAIGGAAVLGAAYFLMRH